jgi:hypothetical protein
MASTLERLKALRRVAGGADIGWEKKGARGRPFRYQKFPQTRGAAAI